MASVGTCSHCGTQGVAIKHCSRCKKASYCGAECQKAAWKGHKATCEPKLTSHDLIAKVNAAKESFDWAGILKWEGRMDEMMAFQGDEMREQILSTFIGARVMISQSALASGDLERHAADANTLYARRVELLGKMERFRDQAQCLCDLADSLVDAGKQKEAASCLQRARDVGAAHGFFSAEYLSCQVPTPHPKPQTPNPKPQTPNPQPQTPNPTGARQLREPGLLRGVHWIHTPHTHAPPPVC